MSECRKYVLEGSNFCPYCGSINGKPTTATAFS
ncbi:MAG: zinc-ribbon domain-containing protein [Candidatus Hodarchaeota archaeon]